MSMESAPEGEVSARADLLSATIWTALGAAITVGAWRMDRLERLNINRYEIPGLVPGLLGAVLTLLGLVLAVRALRQGALQQRGAPASGHGAERWRMAGLFAVMVGYAVVLVGHGLPFWLATAAFVAGFIFFFDRARQQALGRSTGRQAVLALVYGAATSAVVSLVFQNVFYVRLP